MKPAVRFVVLGDIHHKPTENRLWDQAIEDLNALQPDAVLAVGDLTGGETTGTSEGMRQVTAMLDRFHADWYAVIGNHDLQAREFETDEEALASFLFHVRRDTPGFRADFGPVTVLGLSNTKRRRNPVTPNEIVFEADQLDWCRDELARIPDRPVLILAHVPPMGSGLITMAELHAHVGNAFANQNHRSGDIMKLARDHSNILMWFSGHNHLGQHYRDAVSTRLGISFVHTGVVGGQSRDGFRHSRVIDIYPDRLVIGTFDHTLRCRLPELDHVEPHSLEALLDYRRAIHERRFVPVDPATMRQGPGPQVRASNARRFAFLSDAHLADQIPACQGRVFEWAMQIMKGHAVDDLVLGGDLTHHADPDEALLFMQAVGGMHRPMLYLPGNNETAGLFPDGRAGTHPFVRRLEVLKDWPGDVFALATTCRQDADEAVCELLKELPEAGPVLVLAHFPPGLLTPELLEKLSATRTGMDWICGHAHTGESYSVGNIKVHVCGGLDPVKVRGHTPELLICDWDGATLEIQRWRTPRRFLEPCPDGFNPLGIACKAPVAELFQTALAENIAALQFRATEIDGAPTAAELEWRDQFRARFAPGFLSVHLPNLTVRDEEPIDSAEMAPLLDWAGEMRIDDLTLHLPNVPASRLFQADGSFLSAPWAESCLAALLEIAESAIETQVGLSLENVYHKERVPANAEKLGTRPWHLLRVVEWLREKLRERGHSNEAAARVGVIFDTGHAFRDATVSKEHGLADWLRQVGPFVRLCHIHQTLRENGAMTNHHPITDAAGPHINYTGLLPILREETGSTIPLLIEVRGLEGALTSLRTLRRIFSH